METLYEEKLSLGQRGTQNKRTPQMKKLKVAVVAVKFPCISETFVLKHIIGLMDLNVDVDIYAFSKLNIKTESHKTINKYRLLDKTTFIIKPESLFVRLYKAYGIIKRNRTEHKDLIKKCINIKKYGFKGSLRNIVRIEPFLENRYDIIHAHFGPVGQEMAFLRDVFPKTKLFVTFHGYDIRLGFKKGGHIYKELFQNANKVISICDYNRKKLMALGCPESKMVHLPNGVDLNDFEFVTRKITDCFNITSVARLCGSKNISFALKIMKAIKEEGKYSFKYYVIGEGEKRKELEKKIRRFGLEEHVVLRGAQKQHQVRRHLKEADIFLMPSKDEAFPVCLLEAQACGIPVVTTDVGGIDQAIQDGKTGFLVTLNDVEEAKKRIYALFDDFALREKMGRAGRRYIKENFDIHQLNKQYIQMYNSRRVSEL